ncbi:serine/threonine-protein kinase [Amycolatopsis pigmentata]|uniref:non-specific serine/threonine protein kinase n=1 Tax=Amycolatopsis pigmentata TaxID=450801 RepID=A0ABW5G145_9PSEU
MRPDTRIPGPRLVADRYELTGYLGGGGMADVYRAVDLRLDRLVALKVFRAGSDPAGRVRFEKEARLLAALDHPGLVALHDAGFSDGEPYLVMKLVEGGTLAELLADGPLPVPKVLDLARELTRILAYVHACDVVHRDVKPSNVLLSPGHGAYLADFGISRLLTSRDRPTVAGKIMGTVGYLAPEQVRGEEVTQAADVYALGLVLLECVTGQVEYDGTGVEAAVARLHRAPRIPPELAPPLSTVIRAMTATKPGNRPSMAECVAMLDRRRSPLAGKARRGWILAGSAVAGVAALAAGSSILFSGGSRPDARSPLSIDSGGPVAPPPAVSAPPEPSSAAHEPTLKRGPQDSIVPPPDPHRTITVASQPPPSTTVSVTTTTVVGDPSSDPNGPGNGNGNGNGKTKPHAPRG